MRILHINSNYLYSKLHENLIDELEKKNIDNTIFMPLISQSNSEMMVATKYNINSPVSFNKYDKYFYQVKQNKIYNKLLESVDLKTVDITHAHTLFTDGNVALNLYLKYGLDYIVTVRGGTDIEHFFKRRPFLHSRSHKILYHAQKIIFLSHSSMEITLEKYIKNPSLKSIIKNKSLVIPNGIDKYWFDNEWKPKKLKKPQNLKVIFVGTKEKRKNILGTVEALNILKEEMDINSTLTIIGKNVDNSYLEKVLKSSKVEVISLEHASKQDLINYYRTHDIFVMPSFQETFGLVYPEAMSQGLPVIYTKGQGFDGQFINGLVGYKVDPNNNIDIANKIRLIVNNYEQLSNNAIENYKLFNWQQITEKYIELYNSVN